MSDRGGAIARGGYEAVEDRRAGRIYLIPAVWDRVLAELGQGGRRWDVSSLREADTGTSATPPELIAAIRHALPATTATACSALAAQSTV